MQNHTDAQEYRIMLQGTTCVGDHMLGTPVAAPRQTSRDVKNTPFKDTPECPVFLLADSKYPLGEDALTSFARLTRTSGVPFLNSPPLFGLPTSPDLSPAPLARLLSLSAKLIGPPRSRETYHTGKTCRNILLQASAQDLRPEYLAPLIAPRDQDERRNMFLRPPTRVALLSGTAFQWLLHRPDAFRIVMPERLRALILCRNYRFSFDRCDHFTPGAR